MTASDPRRCGTTARRTAVVNRARSLSASSSVALAENRVAAAGMLHAEAQGLLVALAILDGDMRPDGRWIGRPQAEETTP